MRHALPLSRLASDRRCLAVAAAVLVGLLLSGCASPDAGAADDTTPVDPGPAPSPGPPDVPNVDANVTYQWNRTETGKVRVTASGPAWTFFVLHSAFATPSNDFDVKLGGAATAEAGDGAAGFFVWLPTFTHGTPQAWALSQAPVFQGPTLGFEQGPYMMEGEWSFNHKSDPGATGVIMAIASQTAWTFEARVDVPFGWSGDPWIVAGGDLSFGSSTGGMVATPVAGQMAWEMDVPGEGWTHLQITSEVIEPTSVRELKVTLPGGAGAEMTGTEVGVRHPLGGQTQGANFVDYVGSLADKPGVASVELTYAGGRLTSGFGLVHMGIPADRLDPNMDGPNYAATDWPFAGPWPPV